MFPRKLTGIVPLKCTSSAEAPFSNAGHPVNNHGLLLLSFRLTEDICSRCKPRVAGEHMGEVGVGSIWVSVFLRQSAQMQVILQQGLYTLQDIIQPVQSLLRHTGHLSQS
jgi:hypothetical protein